MNKEINYLIEYLAKSKNLVDSNLYALILSFFRINTIYTPSKYEIKTLKLLAKNAKIDFPMNFEDGLTKLDELLEVNIDSKIKKAKEQLLDTIISTNFKKSKENLDKVETSIYKCLTSYIYGLTRSLELFYVYTKNDLKEPELFIEFSNDIHEKLIEIIFNEEEKKLLSDKLKEIMGVYMSIYARYLYI